ncbi:hypothetical protein LEP1GSC036_0043 [Leptospira weilii str. 2006001853]|uniref:Uncharacterized protein n=2 Tax=Leptospira weilii TaxID=28184 RepID=A0A828YVC6_9LEPT|nr:hypothetical protein LEP1GSC036_0043 [Leptospira weilii str. 2006001853]EMN91637.1 hypothetical protein LEP1GSC108_4938 [Leptospira weilii str. UI 13098]OMI16958.1 hypothetical protein BUQ74_12710 [Leptospira weilii serovar Heyan]QDK21718.1 hypothetical protein FHG67_02345 [Leptospira weilii]QDK25657.1 hypothetical protein FHG68_02195 [Leptospira weilii]
MHQPAHRKFLRIHLDFHRSKANICNIFDLTIFFKTTLSIRGLNESIRTLNHVSEKSASDRANLHPSPLKITLP